MNEAERGKALGASVGISVGIGFAIGIPVSSALTQTIGPNMTLYVSAVGSMLLIVYVIFIPVSDTQCSLHKSAVEVTAAAVSSPFHTDADSSSSIHEKGENGQHYDVQINQKKPTFYQSFMENRRFPASWVEFTKKNHPLTGFTLIREATYPADWLSYFFAYISQQVRASLRFKAFTLLW